MPVPPHEPRAVDPGIVVESTPGSVSLIRRHCAGTCTELGWADEADTVELLVSETATNAIVHGGGPTVRARVLDRGSRLRVEVTDDSPTLPSTREAAAYAESGRGLAMVNLLAVDAGVELHGSEGKTVWFEVGS